MKPLIAALALIIGLMVGIYCYYNYYPPQANKKIIQAALDEFSAAIASKDRAKVSDSLSILLADDAKIHLEVYMFSIRTNQAPPIVQDFDKAQFIQFIDNTLYSLTDYSYTPQLNGYVFDTGAVTFESKEWADGANMMGGVSVDMRYSANTECDGNVVMADKQAKLSSANCKMQFRQVPKPGQNEKFQNLNTLQEMLQKH